METQFSLKRLLRVLPAIVWWAITNVGIGFTTAGVVLIQMLANNYNKYLSLFVAIMVVIAVYFYIAFNHRLRLYIKNQGEDTHE